MTISIAKVEMINSALGTVTVRYVMADGQVFNHRVKFYVNEDAEITFTRPEIMTSATIKELEEELKHMRVIA